MLALKYALGVVVGALGFLYYLIFGARELTPSVHGQLSRQRLARLIAEGLSYGEDGAELTVCLPDGAPGAVLRKEIRAANDVHLVLQGSSPIDFVEDTEQAAAVVADHFATQLGTPLEHGCYYYATRISIYPRHGWSRVAAV